MCRKHPSIPTSEHQGYVIAYVLVSLCKLEREDMGEDATTLLVELGGITQPSWAVYDLL